jgi:hypothetical protein
MVAVGCGSSVSVGLSSGVPVGLDTEVSECIGFDVVEGFIPTKLGVFVFNVGNISPLSGWLGVQATSRIIQTAVV